MKKVITVLVLTLGGCASAVASTCLANPLGTTSTCSASVDGTTFTVSLIGLTSASLTNGVNVDVNAYSTTPGSDVFSVQVAGGNPITSKLNLNYGVSVSGNPGAQVTSVSTMFSGKAAGASLSTEVTPTGTTSLGDWSLTSSLMKQASSSHSTPSFVSAEVNTGLNLPSGLSLAGFTETFTVIWTPATPAASHNTVNLAADPVSNAPEPGSLGLIALAGCAGAFLIRRRSFKK
jgi:hypothetical protein